MDPHTDGQKNPQKNPGMLPVTTSGQVLFLGATSVGFSIRLYGSIGPS